MKKKNLHDITQKTLNNLNKQFKRDHGTSFTTEVKKIFQEERKINKGDIIHGAKENIGQQWKETAVEQLVFINTLLIIYFHFGWVSPLQIK